MREYIIPHNYKDNGRLFNIIERDKAKKALIYTVPVTALFFFLPLDITMTVFFIIIFAAGPAFAIGMGIDDIITDMLKFKRNARVYYDLGKDCEEDDSESYCEVARREYAGQLAANKKHEKYNTNKRN